MKIKIYAVILLFALIFSIGFGSAKVVLSGKVYTQGFGEGISNLEISAYCDGTNLTTITDNEGSYYFVFPNVICGNYSVVSPINDSIVFLYKSSLNESPAFDEVNNYNLSFDFSWNESKNYYFCGNGICDSGESNATCYVDCSLSEAETLPEKNLGLTGNVVLESFRSGTSGFIILFVVLTLSFLLVFFYVRERSQNLNP